MLVLVIEQVLLDSMGADQEFFLPEEEQAVATHTWFRPKFPILEDSTNFFPKEGHDLSLEDNLTSK
jgi:hypothetical protein